MRLSLVVLFFSSIALAIPMPENAPELMKTFVGEKVSTREQWEKVRAPELLKEFSQEEYGARPVERPATLTFEKAEPDAVMMDGKAVRKRIRVMYAGPYGDGAFVFTAFIPRQTKPAPAFLLICNRPPDENINPTRLLAGRGDRLARLCCDCILERRHRARLEHGQP